MKHICFSLFLEKHLWEKGVSGNTPRRSQKQTMKKCFSVLEHIFLDKGACGHAPRRSQPQSIKQICFVVVGGTFEGKGRPRPHQDVLKSLRICKNKSPIYLGITRSRLRQLHVTCLLLGGFAPRKLTVFQIRHDHYA